ncbi:hypothetical protein N9065_00755 [Akkermansiaceae bacterium]|nr:hypothetical protein [Akkermansiaceae bacterium]
MKRGDLDPASDEGWGVLEDSQLSLRIPSHRPDCRPVEFNFC